MLVSAVSYTCLCCVLLIRRVRTEYELSTGNIKYLFRMRTVLTACSQYELSSLDAACAKEGYATSYLCELSSLHSPYANCPHWILPLQRKAILYPPYANCPHCILPMRTVVTGSCLCKGRLSYILPLRTVLTAFYLLVLA